MIKRNKRKKQSSSTVSSENVPSNFSSAEAKRRNTDDEKPPVPWAELPGIAVEKIYSFLNREEQHNMSMVCRNWNKEYSCPSLWRKVEFIIPEHDLGLEIYPEVQFAREYGGMFRHVEIVWPIRMVEYPHTVVVNWKQMKLFLESLIFHSQLETVKFFNMYFWYLADAISDDVYQTLKNFFLSQHQLKTVEFQNAHFKKSESVELLRVILHKNSKSLQNIRLVCEEEAEHEYGDFEISENVGNEEIVETLLNIKTLQLNYSQFFENIMITFYEHIKNSDSRRTKGNLELIEIFCNGSERISYRGIPPECWKLFIKICPSLRIHLIFQIKDQIRNSINLFVVPNMPLKVLRYHQWHWRQDGSETEIGVLFRLLQSCRTNEYLEDLRIVWLRNMNNLAIDLINFLQTCKKLRTLHLSIEHPIESLESVFNSWLENRPPSLQTVDIDVRKVPGSELLFSYVHMFADYRPLLEMHGINLSESVEMIPRRF